MKAQLVIFLALIAMFSMAFGQSLSAVGGLASASGSVAAASASAASPVASASAASPVASAASGSVASASAASPVASAASGSVASVSAASGSVASASAASPAASAASGSVASVSAAAVSSGASPAAASSGASPAAVPSLTPSAAVSTAVPSVAAVSTSAAPSTAAASTVAQSGPATVAPGNPANAPTAIVNNPVPTCGNGIVEFNEDCDTAISTSCCNQFCQFAQANTPCTPLISNLNQNSPGANDGQECLATNIWKCSQVAEASANTTCKIQSVKCTVTTKGKRGKPNTAKATKGRCKTAGPDTAPSYIRCVKQNTFNPAKDARKASIKASRKAAKAAQ